jgi:hypothetical protein
MSNHSLSLNNIVVVVAVVVYYFHLVQGIVAGYYKAGQD